jgi:hypothetical protein
MKKKFKVTAMGYFNMCGRTVKKTSFWELEASDEIEATTMIHTREETGLWTTGTAWKTEEVPVA